MRKVSYVPEPELRMVRVLPACCTSAEAQPREAKKARLRLVLFFVAAIEIVAAIVGLLVG